MSKSKNQLKRSRAVAPGFVARTAPLKGCRSVSVIQILVALGLWITMAELHAGLQRYRDFIVADRDISFAPPKTGVRITYLGTNAYLLQSHDAALLIDPHFSRIGLFRAALNLPVASSRNLTERYLPVRRIDAVLVTHGHFDHLLDVPQIVALTGARLIASATSIQLARSAGVPSEKCVVVTAGEKVALRGATVTSLPAKHDRLFGRVPFDGPPRRLPPRAAGDWVCGEPLAANLHRSRRQTQRRLTDIVRANRSGDPRRGTSRLPKAIYPSFGTVATPICPSKPSGQLFSSSLAGICLRADDGFSRRSSRVRQNIG